MADAFAEVKLQVEVTERLCLVVGIDRRGRVYDRNRAYNYRRSGGRRRADQSRGMCSSR